MFVLHVPKKKIISSNIIYKEPVIIDFNIINLVADESWDVDTPKSPSIGSNLDNENNNQKLGDREQVTSQLQNKEPTRDEQEKFNEVHDFFDS